MRTQFTAQHLSEFEIVLTQHGIAWPGKIERISQGHFGVSLLTLELVLKLFRKFGTDKTQRTLLDSSIGRFEALTDVAEELTQRGIIIPRLLEYGIFSQPMTMAGQEFYAWQLMTRVPGRPLSEIRIQKQQRILADRKQINQMAAVAARIHIPVEVDDLRSLSIGFDTLFFWPGIGRIDTRLHGLIRELQKDILRMSSDKSVFLHGDFHKGNVLKHEKNGIQYFGVIDWDQLELGSPERDVWTIFGQMPQYMHAFCRRYNDTALQPLNERIVLAYSLGHLAVLHHAAMQASKKTEQKSLKNAVNRSRLALLAKRLHHLTKKKIYADSAHYYAQPSRGVPKQSLRNPRGIAI